MTGPATFRLWIGFGVDLFDDTTLATDGNWTDVTDDVRTDNNRLSTFSTSTRRNHFDSFSAGTARFHLANRDRKYDPGYSSGTYYGEFKRNTPIRVTAEHSSTRYTVFFGAVRRWEPDYIATKDGWTTVHCEDMLGVISEYQLPDVSPAAYAGDSTSARVGRVLDEVGFPSGWRSLGNGGNAASHAATDWGEGALRHIVRVSTADGGLVYADRDGTITQDSRNAGGVVSRQTTSQVTLDDTAEPVYLHARFQGVGDDYRDLVRVSAAVGDVQEVDNSATDAAPVVYQQLRTTLESESQAAATANFYADLYSKDRMFPREVTVRLATYDTDLRTVLLPRQLRDRITVTYDPPGAGGAVTYLCFIDGIKHQVSINDWVTTYTLSSADAYDELDGAGSWMIVGDATHGKVGTGRVGY